MSKELEINLCKEIVNKYPCLQSCLTTKDRLNLKKSKFILNTLNNDNEYLKKFKSYVDTYNKRKGKDNNLIIEIVSDNNNSDTLFSWRRC